MRKKRYNTADTENVEGAEKRRARGSVRIPKAVRSGRVQFRTAKEVVAKRRRKEIVLRTRRKVTADVSGGVARRWNSFRSGGHTSGISSATGQGRILPLQEPFLLGALPEVERFARIRFTRRKRRT